jgi:hypothetical protein
MLERTIVVIGQVVIMGLALCAVVGVHIYDAEETKRLRTELEHAKVETSEWLAAFKKLSEKVDPHPSPRRPGQIGDAAPH